MKKLFKFILPVIAVLFFAANANAQTNWVSQKISNKVIVKFPKAPEVLQENVAYKAVGDDSTMYTAAYADLEAMGLDSATLASMVETEEFFEQFKTGFTAQMEGLELKKSEIVKWNGFVSYNLEGDVQAKGKKAFIKTIFIGSHMFTFFCVAPTDFYTKNKEVFVGALELVK